MRFPFGFYCGRPRIRSCLVRGKLCGAFRTHQFPQHALPCPLYAHSSASSQADVAVSTSAGTVLVYDPATLKVKCSPTGVSARVPDARAQHWFPHHTPHALTAAQAWRKRNDGEVEPIKPIHTVLCCIGRLYRLPGPAQWGGCVCYNGASRARWGGRSLDRGS